MLSPLLVVLQQMPESALSASPTSGQWADLPVDAFSSQESLFSHNFEL